MYRYLCVCVLCALSQDFKSNLSSVKRASNYKTENYQFIFMYNDKHLKFWVYHLPLSSECRLQCGSCVIPHTYSVQFNPIQSANNQHYTIFECLNTCNWARIFINSSVLYLSTKNYQYIKSRDSWSQIICHNFNIANK